MLKQENECFGFGRFGYWVATGVDSLCMMDAVQKWRDIQHATFDQQ